ncbi:hypothetical protein [Nonomuraea angiospora]
MSPGSRIAAIPLPGPQMRTIYGLINHGALDLCATFLVEHTAFPKNLKEAQHLVDSLKAGRESLGMKQPLRVSEATMAPIREFVSSGKRVESEFTSASFAVAMEVSISFESATQVIMEMIGQSHIMSRERTTSRSRRLIAKHRRVSRRLSRRACRLSPWRSRRPGRSLCLLLPWTRQGVILVRISRAS